MDHKNTSAAHMATPIFLLSAGSSLYYLLEVLLRGFSHWTMAVCGGLCLLLIYYMNRRLASEPLIFRALLGALIITAVELVAGCILNLRLGKENPSHSDMMSAIAELPGVFAIEELIS
jgi:hypothetical protein